MRFQKHLRDAEGGEASTVRGLREFAGARVLEIGCGDGRLTFGYARAARSVYAFDPSEEGIAKARRETPADLAESVRFEVGSALDFIPPPEPFDVAFFAHSL